MRRPSMTASRPEIRFSGTWQVELRRDCIRARGLTVLSSDFRKVRLSIVPEPLLVAMTTGARAPTEVDPIGWTAWMPV